MKLKDNEKKNKQNVRCPYCGHKFMADDSDIDYVSNIPTYWCRNEHCGENFVEDMRLGNNETHVKREWI